MTALQTLWLQLGPVSTRPSSRELLRAILGAALGMAIVGLLAWADRFAHTGLLFLFAPLGATAVLVFAVPSSPLAQPWNCVVGNTVSALWTLTLLQLAPSMPLPLCAALAVGGAIAIMLACHALHPPGGAVALLTVLSASSLLPLGWWLLVPMAVMTACLVLAGVLFHRATGRAYLHRPHAAPAVAAQPQAGKLALSQGDLQALLTRFDQSYNLTTDDLGDLLAAAEEEAIKRRFAAISCGQVMSSQLLTVSPQTSLEIVADLFHRHLVKSLPVVDDKGQLIGRVLRADLFDWLWQGHRDQQQKSLWQRLRRPARQNAPQAVAQDMMREPELCVQESTPVGDLLHELASHTVQFIAVQRGDLLVGVITRSDVIRTLLSINS